VRRRGATALEFHQVANLFPLMEGEEFEKLKADIAAHGQREPIWVRREPIPNSTMHEYTLKIIDGRNRYRACRELGIEPKTQEWDGNGSLVQFVVSLNLHRRHLDSGQRATVGAAMLPLLRAEAKQRQRAAGGDKRITGAEVTDAGSQATRVLVHQHYGPYCEQPDGTWRSPEGREASAQTMERWKAKGCIREGAPAGTPAEPPANQPPQGPDAEQALPQKVGEAPPGKDRHAGEAVVQAAKIVGTNPQYIRDAEKLKEQNPQTFEEVKTGKVKLKEATARLKANKPASAKDRRLQREEEAERLKKRQATKERKQIANALSRLDADTRQVLGDHEVTRQVQVVYLAGIQSKDERLAIAMLLAAGEVGEVWAAHQRLVEIGVQTVLARADGPAPGAPL
jgi:hypothetical protein